MSDVKRLNDGVRGHLVIIGGAEDKRGRCVILREFVRLAGGNESVVAVVTAATEDPDKVFRTYREVFSRLRVRETCIVRVDRRDDAFQEEQVDRVNRSTGIFFTGGDQLRITSAIGGTPLYGAFRAAAERGAVIAGTSAGASVMSDTMIVGGEDDGAPKRCTTAMAPGMGLLRQVVVDQHFAQRGRIGRLLSALAQNPLVLGVGIDEDTAIVIRPGGLFKVHGSQTVTIVDGQGVAHTNASESAPDEPLALFGVTLHILPAGHGYDLERRQPIGPDALEGEE
ncbi:MAG: cyanophycinase [Bacillota bacterium]